MRAATSERRRSTGAVGAGAGALAVTGVGAGGAAGRAAGAAGAGSGAVVGPVSSALAVAQDQQPALAHVQRRAVGLQRGSGEIGLARLHGRDWRVGAGRA
ncbi:hypothetical protein G6F23_013428 [Rhizopus arrhizus]|nr:hypothetical protein G6F23_013428 [Rhizopus arrhizus]